MTAEKKLAKANIKIPRPDFKALSLKLVSFLECYKEEKTWTDACYKSGVDRSDIEFAMINDSNFYLCVTRIEAEILDDLEKVLMKKAGLFGLEGTKAAKAANVQSIIALLKAKSSTYKDVKTKEKLKPEGIQINYK